MSAQVKRTLLWAVCAVIATVALATVTVAVYALTEDTDSPVCKEHGMCVSGAK